MDLSESQKDGGMTAPWLHEAIGQTRILDMLSVAVYICEARTGTIQYFNQLAADLWGSPPTVGDSATRFCGSYRLFRLDGSPLPHDQTPMAKALQDGLPVHNTKVIIERPDGSRVTVLANIDPIRSAQNEIVGAINILRDVTEETRADGVQNRLAAIVESSEDAIISKDLQGIITGWNAGAERIFGYSPSEAIGQPVEILAAPDRANEMPNILARIRNGERVAPFETVRRRKDGRLIQVSLTVSPIRDREGYIIGASKITRDITEQKEREEELHRVQAERAAIVDSALDCLITIDHTGLIHEFNAAAERTFGYRREDAIGRELAELIVPPAYREGHRRALRRVFETGESKLAGRRLELTAMNSDGTEFPVELAISLVRTGDQALYIGFLHDISDRKLREDERALLLAREQEARSTAELLNRIGPNLLSELDLEKLVQFITDVATTLVGAEFGSFFHNVLNETGESYMLYALSGVPREAFAGFPMPRNTDVFAPTFRGEGIIRSDDITQDPRYGRNAPYYGMPKGHLPVRSYLAAPVVARSGEVLGGLFFGHSATGRFTAQHEVMLAGIAAQAAIAMDNARLFEKAQWAQNELQRSNEDLRRANQDLEMFAYSASHDLQEPLRNIAISAQLLDRICGDQLDSEGKSFVSDILQGARRMDSLVQDLLAYTTATKHAEGPPPIVDSDAVLWSVLEGLKESIEQAAATMSRAE
jgi:PAS domain S-box-containing protein